MDWNDFFKSVKEGRFDSVYLFTGPEELTKKEALLQAAKELFGEYGFAETTFKKISDRAGVALGLLTHHYGNKEKLFFCEEEFNFSY